MRRHVLLWLCAALPSASAACTTAEGAQAACKAAEPGDDPALLQVTRRQAAGALGQERGSSSIIDSVPNLIREAQNLGLQVVQCAVLAGEEDPCAQYIQAYFQGAMPTPPGSNIPNYSSALDHPSNAAFIVQRDSSKGRAVADVMEYIGLCKRYGVTPIIKSSGSSFGRWSSYGKVPFVLQPNHFEVDYERNTVTLDSAHKLYDIYSRLERLFWWRSWEDSHLLVGGNCAQVSLGGFLQGAGHSAFSRAFGMASDSVLSAEVVLANTSLVTADEVSHPELFWALRGGGGGNWGVVVSFTLQLRPYPNGIQFYFGVLPYSPAYVRAYSDFWTDPATSNSSTMYLLFMPSLTTGFDKLLSPSSLPAGVTATEAHDVSATIRAASTPGFGNGFLIYMFISIDTQEAAEATWTALETKWLAAVPSVQSVRPALKLNRLTQLQYDFLWNLVTPWGLDASKYFENMMFVQGSGMFTRAGDREAHILHSSADSVGVTGLIPLGGAVAEKSSNATAFPWRHASFIFDIELDAAHADRSLSVIRSLYELPSFVGNFMAYLGVSEPVGDFPGWPERYYGNNLQKALRVKKTYDSEALFAFPYGISNAG